jgi:hypothetical protein
MVFECGDHQSGMVLRRKFAVTVNSLLLWILVILLYFADYLGPDRLYNSNVTCRASSCVCRLSYEVWYRYISVSKRYTTAGR